MFNSAKYRLNCVLEVDIKGCFDNISHDFLLKHVPVNKHILKEWIKCGYTDRVDEKEHELFSGVPQGGIVSPTLCNITLNGLDSFLKEYLENRLAKDKNPDRKFAILIRYADDMIYICRTKRVAELALQGIQEFLKNRGLEIKVT